MKFLLNMSERLTYLVIKYLIMDCYDVIVHSKQTLTYSTISNLKIAFHEIANDFESMFYLVSDL